MASLWGREVMTGRGTGPARWRNGTPSTSCAKAGAMDRAIAPLTGYWQLGNLNDAMRVLQLNVPLAFRYSVVKKNVQSSSGSSVIAA